MDVALAGEGPLHGTDNLLRDLTFTRGDVALAMRRAAAIIEQTYTTGAQEHVYLEPQGMQAVWDGDQVTVLGSMQCPYYVVDGLAHVFGLSPAQIHVRQCVTGGAFGGKEEDPTLFAVHTALLARKAGRPTTRRAGRSVALEPRRRYSRWKPMGITALPGLG